MWTIKTVQLTTDSKTPQILTLALDSLPSINVGKLEHGNYVIYYAENDKPKSLWNFKVLKLRDGSKMPDDAFLVGRATIKGLTYFVCLDRLNEVDIDA